MAIGWLATLLLLMAFSTALAGGGKGFKGKGDDKGAGKGYGKGEDRPNARERRAMARLAAMLLSTPASSSSQGPAPSGLDVLYELYHSQHSNVTMQQQGSTWQHQGQSQWQPEQTTWVNDQWDYDDGSEQEEQWAWVRVGRPRLQEQAGAAPWLHPGTPLPTPTMPFPNSVNASSIHRCDTGPGSPLGMFASVQTRMLPPGGFPVAGTVGHAVPASHVPAAPAAQPAHVSPLWQPTNMFPAAPAGQLANGAGAVQPPNMFPPEPVVPIPAALVPQPAAAANAQGWNSNANSRSWIQTQSATVTETETAIATETATEAETQTESQFNAQWTESKRREDKRKAEKEHRKNSAPRTCFVCHQRGYQWGQCSNPNCPTNGGPDPIHVIATAVQALADQVAKSTKTPQIKAMPKSAAPVRPAPKSPGKIRKPRTKKDDVADKVVDVEENISSLAVEPSEPGSLPSGHVNNADRSIFEDATDGEDDPNDTEKKPDSEKDPSSK